MPDARKAARWDALVASGLSPNDATAAVEREWQQRAMQWDAMVQQGVQPDSATARVERLFNAPRPRPEPQTAEWSQRRQQAALTHRAPPTQRQLNVNAVLEGIGGGVEDLPQIVLAPIVAYAQSLGMPVRPPGPQEMPEGHPGEGPEETARRWRTAVTSPRPTGEGPSLRPLLDIPIGMLRMGYDLQQSIQDPNLSESEKYRAVANYLTQIGLLGAMRKGEVRASRNRANYEATARADAAIREPIQTAAEARAAMQPGALLGGTAEQAAADLASRQAAYDAALAPARAEIARGKAFDEMMAPTTTRPVEQPITIGPGEPQTANPMLVEPHPVDLAPRTLSFTPRVLYSNPWFDPAMLRRAAQAPETAPIVGGVVGGGLTLAQAPAGSSPEEKMLWTLGGALVGVTAGLAGRAAVGAGKRAWASRPYGQEAAPTTAGQLRPTEAVNKRIAQATPPPPPAGEGPQSGLWPHGLDPAATYAERQGWPVEARRYWRPDKLGVDPNDAQAMAVYDQAMGEAVTAARARGIDPHTPVPWELVQERAAREALDPAAILRKDPARMTSAEFIGQDIVNTRVKGQIDDLMRQRGAPDLTAGQALDLDNAINAKWAQLRAGLLQSSRAVSQFGRDLNAARILIRDATDPIVWQRVAAKIKGGPLTLEEMRRIDTLGRKGDMQAVATALRQLQPGHRWRQMATLLRVGYLTKLSTHIRNVGGNAVHIVARTASDIPASLIDEAIGAMTGQYVKSWQGIRAAAARGAVNGWQEAQQMIRTGASAEEMAKWNLEHGRMFENPLVNAYVEVVTRGLGAEDVFFRKIAYARALQEEAYSMARSARLRGASLEAEAQRLLANPTDEMIATAASEGEQAVFRQQTALNAGAEGLIRGLRQAGKHKTAAFTEGVVIPFTRTPFAVGATALDYSPFGFLRGMSTDLWSVYKAATKGDTPAVRAAQRVFVNRTARGLTGSAGLVTLGYKLREHDLMTGAYPRSQSERKQWELDGRTAYSVRIRGKWRSLTGVAPWGTLMAMGASLYDARQRTAEGLEAQAAMALGGAAGTIINQPALQGSTQLFGAVSDIAGAGVKYARNLAGNPVPGIVGSTAQTLDPVMRRPRNAAQAFAARVPGLSLTVPERQNVFGETMRREGNIVQRAIRAFADPMASSPDKARRDPLLREMQRVGAALPPLTPHPDETPEDFAVRERIVGPARKAAVVAAVNEDPYYRDEQLLTEEARWRIAEGQHQNSPYRAYRKLSIAASVRRVQAEMILRADQAARRDAGESLVAEEEDLLPPAEVLQPPPTQ